MPCQATDMLVLNNKLKITIDESRNVRIVQMANDTNLSALELTDANQNELNAFENFNLNIDTMKYGGAVRFLFGTVLTIVNFFLIILFVRLRLHLNNNQLNILAKDDATCFPPLPET